MEVCVEGRREGGVGITGRVEAHAGRGDGERERDQTQEEKKETGGKGETGEEEGGIWMRAD